MRISKAVLICVGLCLIGISDTEAHAVSSQRTPKPIESTLAWEMFQTEKEVRSGIPDGEEAVLRQALDAATKAALAANPDPRTPAEALVVLRKMQVAFEEQGFLQPYDSKYWPNTLGEAFTPYTQTAALDDPVKNSKEYHLNTDPAEGIGARTANTHGKTPIYLVDCDMGAMLFISVGQRLGWDIRLAEAEIHNYMFFLLPDGTPVSWDWTYRKSYDGATPPADNRYADWPDRNRTGKPLTMDFARSYYLTVMTLKPINKESVISEKKRALLEKALKIDPTNDWAQNGLAWNYATDPALTPAQAKTAMAYALAAWSAMPWDGNVIDTAACAMSRNKYEKDLAIAVENFALSAAKPSEEADFQAHLTQMQSGHPCVDAP